VLWASCGHGRAIRSVAPFNSRINAATHRAAKAFPAVGLIQPEGQRRVCLAGFSPQADNGFTNLTRGVMVGPGGNMAQGPAVVLSLSRADRGTGIASGRQIWIHRCALGRAAAWS